MATDDVVAEPVERFPARDTTGTHRRLGVLARFGVFLPQEETFPDFIGRYAVVFFLVILTIVYCFTLPSTFATFSNFRTITTSQAPLIVMAIGLMFPVAAGEFDLSFGPVAGFSCSL